MRNHRLPLCGTTLSLVLLLFEPVIDAAQSLILNETIEVQGKKVGMQMLTLECPYFGKSGWANNNSIFSIHLTDTRALPGGVTPRLQAHGFYSFIQQKWLDFKEIDENRIVTDKYELDYLWRAERSTRLRDGTYVNYGDTRRFHGRNCGTFVSYIDRNSLHRVWEIIGGNPHGEETRGVGIAFCEKPAAFNPPETRVSGQCRLVPYKAPPERIGF